MRMPVLWLALALLAPAAQAGPREFGLEELAQALTARGLTLDIRTELRPGPPESFEILADRVVGADERGLMYGLLAAAEQIRDTGRLAPERGVPHTAIRGIRRFLHNEAMERDWYYSQEHWDAFFGMLARQRFNRFNLVFAHQTNYLAPPYPFWLDLPAFPEIRVPGLSATDRQRNLAMLCAIARTAADHGIDFTLGIWEHNIQPGMQPTVEGLTSQNIGPYSYAALRRVLQACPAISSVQMRTNNESGIPPEQQIPFYRDHVFPAIRDAGRPVTLDLRGWIVAGGMVEAAAQVGIPVRLSTKYWAEHLGRPYQPAETYPNYSYLNFLAKPRSYRFYWELWGLGSHRLLLWGNPGYVRRAVSTFGLGGAEGFEIDAPLAQKGFGNAPETWGVFTDAELARRQSWRWEWERYWLFYTLWGRLSYDPDTSDSVWRRELEHRFGPAADDVLAAYTNASQILNEIVAVHLADPNMGLWPEINPGGLIDAYKDVLPSDWRFVAGPAETAANRVAARASAKQTPAMTAARLDRWAEATERAIERANGKLAPDDREWLSSEPDFLVLAHLARYHARKQLAAEALALFDGTGDPAPLPRARRELETALAIWTDLVRLTDGLYPERMAFAPDDNGHWKDKLPYVQHDLRLIEEREEVLRRFEHFERGFDFGGPVPEPAPHGTYWHDPFILRNTVAPRFQAVDPGSLHDPARSFGWLGGDQREALAIEPTPYLEVRAVIHAPKNLPHDMLFHDAIRGEGAQTFAVDVPPGDYTVTFLHPGRTSESRQLRAENGRLAIVFPENVWTVSGLVIQSLTPPAPTAVRDEPPLLPRPAMRHNAPTHWPAGRPLGVELALDDTHAVHTVRLHYRPVNQLASFKTLESGPDKASFTIPGADITSAADLMYYFELLRGDGGGWFEPDPLERTPYYVVEID
jgi:hypothetical protein